MDADEAVRAASMIPNTELAAAAGLPLDPSGRIRVDGALRSPACPEVYGAGDAPAASSPEGGRAADGVRDRDAHGLVRRLVESSRRSAGGSRGSWTSASWPSA
ncbi:FAD-dependent oxidoreductase [Streptomyces sp. NPDC059544]|uniref:FAD-dependent oxidoreductase n=1 Tax=Streptomyces sp. NPDC059544 TaxID=3346861 RepID=UPI003699628B